MRPLSGSDAGSAKTVSISGEKEQAQEKEVMPAQLHVAILNGGAVSGSAASMKKFLDSLGYGNVEAKNAQDKTGAGTTIFYNSEFQQAAQKMSEDLKNNYPNIQTNAASTDEQKGADLVVVMGKPDAAKQESSPSRPKSLFSTEVQPTEALRERNNC